MSSPRKTGPAEVLASRRVVATVGTGGVGKTTVAAALGLGAARRGARVLVLTIDPARRLADALGVGQLGHEPQPIGRSLLDSLGVPPGGSLHAMMLDMKRTFDDLVNRFAEDEASRRRILENPIYQNVSDALAGSAEYSAMEKVFEMSEREDFDVIVLDTPPSRHALDFLEAPERLIGLLDSRLVHLLLHPAMSAGRFSLRIFQRAAHRAFGLMERVTGFSFLEDVSEFLLSFEAMSEGFRERARRVQALLFGPESAFVLVATPAERSVAQSLPFLERLAQAHAPIAGVIVNRVRCWPSDQAPSEDFDRGVFVQRLADALAEAEGAEFPARPAAEAARGIFDGYAAMVRRDRESQAPLLERARENGWFSRRIPELPADVHDLEGLSRMADALTQAAREDAAWEGRHGE